MFLAFISTPFIPLCKGRALIGHVKQSPATAFNVNFPSNRKVVHCGMAIEDDENKKLLETSTSANDQKKLIRYPPPIQDPPPSTISSLFPSPFFLFLPSILPILCALLRTANKQLLLTPGSNLPPLLGRISSW